MYNSTDVGAVYSEPLFALSWFPDRLDNLVLAHLHEIVYSFLFYQICHWFVSPWLNRIAFGRHYSEITDKKLKFDFDVHTVSMIQAFVSMAILIPTLWLPSDLNIVTYVNPWCSMVAALTCGYFIWDLGLCVRHYSIYGFEFLLHAVGAFAVMFCILTPFCQPWVGKYLLFEASTPFVNMNWYTIQLNHKHKSASGPVIPMWLNAINGLLLLTVFFSVRIVWGWGCNLLLLRQVWRARSQMPIVVGGIVISLNITMSLLNVVWFSKMLKIAKKMLHQDKKQD
ncbi:hypothetical protein RNJ44_01286 [Nakaseomyces bracarensis]|uniref:TLC domain-containing protein n=1 Tax=Nakaseomyces bracarensis TaxID=273131 RepID=A0ABR4NRH8_9SACH